ncbi:hypothetical protein SeMB42_g04791 [Synchytrium endobioticum]|uniref:Uncharacterized protein n=1 Tax=Synchytrium endobioticum TaxID=286115 RepID=A0A507DC07_9FUNG|nr:hypothetical protein SeMB42_g04791 [Synchytrium endobioticum]TPX49124.1 hypothetical protein SeLEV6574_g01629 [Synchytrium endobioticum]
MDPSENATAAIPALSQPSSYRHSRRSTLVLENVLEHQNGFLPPTNDHNLDMWPSSRARIPSIVNDNGDVLIDTPDFVVNPDSTAQELLEHANRVSHPATVLGVFDKWNTLQVHSRPTTSGYVGDRQTTNTKKQDTTEHDELCTEVLSALGELEASIEEVMRWKDSFISNQGVPSVVKLKLMIMFTRLFRSKSDLHEPLFELIKQVRVFSEPWSDRRRALLAIENDFETQKHLVDVAIRRAEHLETQIARMKSEKRIGMWERLAGKLMKRQSNRRQEVAHGQGPHRAKPQLHQYEQADSAPELQPTVNQRTRSLHIRATAAKAQVQPLSPIASSMHCGAVSTKQKSTPSLASESVKSLTASHSTPWSTPHHESHETQTDDHVPSPTTVSSQQQTSATEHPSTSDLFLSDKPSSQHHSKQERQDALVEFEEKRHIQHPNIEQQLLGQKHKPHLLQGMHLPPVARDKKAGGSEPSSPIMGSWTDVDIGPTSPKDEYIPGNIPSWLSFDGDVNVARSVGQSKEIAGSDQSRESISSSVGGNFNSVAGLSSGRGSSQTQLPPTVPENTVSASQLKQLQDAYAVRMKAMEDSYIAKLVELSAKMQHPQSQPSLDTLPPSSLYRIAQSQSSLQNLSTASTRNLPSLISTEQTFSNIPATSSSLSSLSGSTSLRTSSPIPKHKQGSTSNSTAGSASKSLQSSRPVLPMRAFTAHDASSERLNKNYHAEFMPHPGHVRSPLNDGVVKSLMGSVRSLRHDDGKRTNGSARCVASTVNLFDNARKKPPCAPYR